ncbi:hypothetical protein EXIGLDRAFT_387006 [Exidia glandulosa HHB12029]|uniref:Uncharacterized protein n=1 Tax=Exidia glandulosa HHB12029 TaxID=1314781 RepID=A0A165L1F2_EXIGL|nr:hypothetical protein EXIGLDRAFT_387006 [Exidia glandulosa HHB12029]
MLWSGTKSVVNVRPGAHDPRRRQPARIRTVEVEEADPGGGGLQGVTFWGSKRDTLAGTVKLQPGGIPGVVVLNL